MKHEKSGISHLQKTLIGAGVILIAAIGTLNVFADTKVDKADKAPQMMRQLPPIGYHKVTGQQINIVDEMPGRTVAAYTAEVRPQVSGIVIQQLFEEGSSVTKDQPLYQIEPSEYKASLAQAKANLKRAEAMLVSAKNQYERNRGLITKKSISQQTYDNSYAAYLGALADIDSAKATIKLAEINLSYTTVKSPIAGRVGRSSITEGALVTANQMASLATVQSFNPIHVDLTSSTNKLLAFRRALMQGKYKAPKESSHEIVLILEDGSEFPFKGKFLFTDVNVNQTTSSYALRVEFPNEGEFLLPGMFVRAKIPKAELPNGVLIPAKALMRTPKGEAYVYVINENKVIEARTVQTGALEHNQWVIFEGLTINDKIVVEGLQFVRPDTPVSTMFDVDDRQNSTDKMKG